MRHLQLFTSIIVTLLITINSSAQITEIGLASFYADKYDGRVTASGDIFDQNKMTAAHRTLPFGTKVKVTNIGSKQSVVVVINDRGPFVDNRVIDLSKTAAKELDFITKGTVRVRVEVITLGKTKQTKSTKYKHTTTSPTTPKKATVTTTTAVVKSKQKPTSIQKADVEYYKIETDLITPQGFGIQIASYKEAANLMKRCSDIKKSINKDIIVQVSDNGESKVYRIIIGSFTTRTDATAFNKSLNNRFAGSFIVTL